MTELKPCPFCGGEAMIAHGRCVDDESVITTTVLCKKCLVGIFRYRENGHDFEVYFTEQTAADAWNRRAGGDAK